MKASVGVGLVNPYLFTTDDKECITCVAGCKDDSTTNTGINVSISLWHLTCSYA